MFHVKKIIYEKEERGRKLTKERKRRDEMIEKGPKLFAISSNFKAAMNDNDKCNCKRKWKIFIMSVGPTRFVFGVVVWNCQRKKSLLLLLLIYTFSIQFKVKDGITCVTDLVLILSSQTSLLFICLYFNLVVFDILDYVLLNMDSCVL